MHRVPVRKGQSVSKFNAQNKRTKALNMRASQRGGIRL